MPASPVRLLALALAAGIGMLAGGAALEWARFGATEASALARLEQDVRRRVADRQRQVEGLARRVSGLGPEIAAARTSRARIPTLFGRLADLAQPAVERGASVTLYVPEGPPGEYDVIAWSAGPADQLPPGRLDGPSQLFVAQGASGPRLVYKLPIEEDGRRVAVAVAETLLAPTRPRVSGGSAFEFESGFGRVTAIPVYAGAGAGAAAGESFVIETPDGATLLEVDYAPALMEAARSRHRRVTLVLASAPLIALLLLLADHVRLRRPAGQRSASAELRAALPAGALALGAATGLALLLRLLDASLGWYVLLAGATALVLVLWFPAACWWRPGSRHSPTGRPVRFVVEQLAGGLLLAAGLTTISWFVATVIEREALDPWHSALFPLSGASVRDYSGLLLVEIALGWGVAVTLAALATRWRLGWRQVFTGLAAAACWFAPTVLLVAASAAGDVALLLPAALLTAAVGAILFALWSGTIRRRYRHASQAARLLLLLAAMAAPPLLLVQVFDVHAERRVRLLVEREYLPALANHPVDLRDRLARAQIEIDAMGNLGDLVNTPSRAPAVTSRSAFVVWNQTNLSTGRLTSEVELFGADRQLVSRFGLNVPEFEYVEGVDVWQGTGCEWRVFDELRRFGGEDRRMSHAERGICGPDGALTGAVVVHVLPDYYSLPFVASANTYYDLLSSPETADPGAGSELSVVVYGWGLNPLFTAGPAAWSIVGETGDRLYQSREPFWARREVDGRRYGVYFGNDRAGIYAVGYPEPTWFEASMRAADTAALTAGLFVLFLLASTLYVPASRRTDPPALRQLFLEIRTSFYRKLFLFFVLAAVGPVFLLTLSFGAYMSAKLQADVEAEAASVVRVARRQFEQASAAVQHLDEPQRPPTDDEMVFIRQTIDQDVNLYLGSELRATSQRDLFEAGLLPTRTPAAAYRAIALDRLPSYVDEDRLGTFQYLIAAAPVPALHGEDGAVLTVPLALRQRDIARDLQELNRGVLVGAVVVVLFAAGLGASVAGRVSDPVERLSRATRQIAAGQLDVRIVADTADELRRLVEDFNSMAQRLRTQRAELARSQQLQAWAEMARQVAHEIKNPLTPIQLAAEHLERVHTDRGRPLGAPFEQCLQTIYRQVRNLRQIASEFSNFAGSPTPHLEAVDVRDLVAEVLAGYRLSERVTVTAHDLERLPRARADRTLIARALTNLVENAVQAMPGGGEVRVTGRRADGDVEIVVEDTGVGMDEAAAARAFEPYFSTKTGGSGLGLANARRNVDLCGGTLTLSSAPGRGTVVTMRLPAAGPPAGAAA